MYSNLNISEFVLARCSELCEPVDLIVKSRNHTGGDVKVAALCFVVFFVFLHGQIAFG